MKDVLFTISEVFVSILIVLTFVYSASGFIHYMGNVEQNAFAFCEMVICLYCATSILLKAILVKRSNKTNSSDSEEGNFN